MKEDFEITGITSTSAVCAGPRWSLYSDQVTDLDKATVP